MVSIVTATYNNAETILETYTSILQQTYEKWEWIVVNDGSTDTTKDILEAINDPRVVVLHLENNVGVSAARNAGLKLMKGSHILLLDGDDLLPATSLQSRISLFERDGDLEFVDGKVVKFVKNPSNEVDQYIPQYKGYGVRLKLLSLDGSVFFGTSWMIKKVCGKSYVFKEGLTHGEDLLFLINISKSGKYSSVEDPVLYYRVHDSSAMGNIRKLSKGYVELTKEVCRFDDVSKFQQWRFKKKCASIVTKSNLKVGRFFDALKYSLWVVIA